jgi:hypothetical protein
MVTGKCHRNLTHQSTIEILRKIPKESYFIQLQRQKIYQKNKSFTPLSGLLEG